MVWKKVNKLSDIERLEKEQRKKIMAARKNIKLIRGTRKNIKRGDSDIRVNLDF